MEQLIPWHMKLCEVCKSPFLFRLSRFGCGFTCTCKVFIRLHDVLTKYCTELRDGANHLAFVPHLESIDGDDTWQGKVITLECLCTEDVVCATCHNFGEAEVNEMGRALSVALRNQCIVERCRIRFSLTLLDLFCSELQSLCDGASLPFSFLLNPPSQEVVTVARWRPQRCAQSISSFLPAPLRSTLHKHQLDGIEQVITLGARVLLADEMGVGKTLQALGVVAVLRAYPVFIVCPSTLKVMWAEEVEKYLHGQLSVDEICVVHGVNDIPASICMTKVLIVSYQMVTRLRQWLASQKWRCVICDESHILHTNLNGRDATYTSFLIEMAHRCRYCLLLSGTPAFNQVFDMYNQISTLRPGILGPTRWHFAMRYCHVIFSPHARLVACDRPDEFASLLRHVCMVRRTKAEVLELAAKTRVVLRVHNNTNVADNEEAGSAGFQDTYARSWGNKRKGIAEAVMYCVQKYARVVLFAHHVALLDFLDELLTKQHVRHIVIDGRVSVQSRASLLYTFHTNDAAVAVIGITACAVGISLACASCAVFCELPPDVRWMRQAEDRLHRPGQIADVTIYYLVGLHSRFDARHLTRLSSNLEDVTRAMNGSQPCDTTLHLSHVTRVPCGQVQLTNSAACPPCTLSPCTRPLLFLLSRHTGRIHVRNESCTLYETFSMDEASTCVRRRNSVVWLQLGYYLDSLDQHSSFHRRALMARALWLPCKFSAYHALRTTGSRTRYRNDEVALGWGLWWRVKQDGGTAGGAGGTANRFYFTNLTCREGVLRPHCLRCGRILPSLSRDNVRAGSVLSIELDLLLFCSGACRRRFFLTRSSGALRRSVQTVDRGVCAMCHVNCEQLCALMTAASTRASREELVRQYHPQMFNFPALLRAFLRRPAPGSLWHADHIIPVIQGGGQATLDNMQTLCVVCHALKTRRERQGGQYTGLRTASKGSEQHLMVCASSVQSTVGWAVRKMTSHTSHTRVSNRRIRNCTPEALTL